MKNQLLSLLLVFLSVPLLAQDTKEKYAEIQPLIDELYAVISGPPGARDWDLFKSLFHANGTMGAIRTPQEGENSFAYFTPEGYIERSGAMLEKNGFFEEEIANKKLIYGGVAQVFTAYQYRFKADGPIERTGINCIQLAFEKGRWWITNIIWEATTEGNPLPRWAKKAQKKKKK